MLTRNFYHGIWYFYFFRHLTISLGIAFSTLFGLGRHRWQVVSILSIRFGLTMGSLWCPNLVCFRMNTFCAIPQSSDSQLPPYLFSAGWDLIFPLILSWLHPKCYAAQLGCSLLNGSSIRGLSIEVSSATTPLCVVRGRFVKRSIVAAQELRKDKSNSGYHAGQMSVFVSFYSCSTVFMKLKELVLLLTGNAFQSHLSCRLAGQIQSMGKVAVEISKRPQRWVRRLFKERVRRGPTARSRSSSFIVFGVPIKIIVCRLKCYWSSSFCPGSLFKKGWFFHHTVMFKRTNLYSWTRRFMTFASTHCQPHMNIQDHSRIDEHPLPCFTAN